MTLTQAILLGIVFWFCRLGILYGWPKNIPIVTSLFIGLILGDVPKAMIVGGALQAIYIGVIAPGANIPTDQTLATFVAVPLAITTNMSPEMAVALAMPVGLLGVAIDYVRRTLNAAWVHMADKYAEEADTRGIIRCAYVYPPLMLIPLYVIPVTVAAYLGPTAVDAFLNAVPKSLIHGFELAGGMLPALGFAITMMVIGRRNLIPYFIAGFFLTKYSGLSIIALAVFGTVLAFLHIQYANGGGAANGN